jgi:hypothetical protein
MSKVRQYFYLIAGLVAGILPILLNFNTITSDQSASITTLLATVASLIGAGAAGTAGVIVSKQRADGTLGTTAVDQVLNGIPVVVAAVAQAQSDLDKVRQTASDALGGIPLFGKEAQDILNGLPRF